MDKVTRQCPQTTTFLKRKESRSGIEPRSFRYASLGPFFYSRRLHGALCLVLVNLVVKCCFDSIKVILCRSMRFRIVFCLADFMFSVYFGLKLTY